MPLDREITPSFTLEHPKEEGFDAVRCNGIEMPYNTNNPAEIWGKFEAGAFHPTGFDVLGQTRDPETELHTRWFRKFLKGETLAEQLEEIRILNQIVHVNRTRIFGSEFEKIINHESEGKVCRHIIALQNRLKAGNVIEEPSLGRLYETTDLLIGEEIRRIF